MSGIRVAIRCDFISGGNIGGVEQFVASLVKNLGEHSDEIEYRLVTHPRDPHWPEDYMGENMKIVPRPWDSYVERFRSYLGPLETPLKSIVKPIVTTHGKPSVPDDGGFYESLDVDLVHHPTQQFVDSTIPSIYNPWDIQHVYYPEFFSDRQIEWRDTIYRAGCERADAIEVPTGAVRQNITKEYGIDDEKIFVIYPGPPTDAHDELDQERIDSVIEQYGLNKRYLFYPAQTWPHKNHKRLVRAVARLRDGHDHDLSLICAGDKKEHWPEIQSTIKECDMGGKVHFPGFVDNEFMGVFYRNAECLIFPSLYEGLGMPLLEAWQYDTPVCCSDISPLSDIAGEAALRFDPESFDDMADSIDRLLTDRDLRLELVEAGRQRLSSFSWERAARAHCALYKYVAGIELDYDERSLLGA